MVFLSQERQVLSYQRAASSYWWINFPLPNTVLIPGFFGSIWILTSLITLIYDALSSPGILPLSHRMTHFSPILSEEHDSIPRWEAIVKMEAYSRMLDKVQTNDERMTRSRPGKIVWEGRLTPRNSRVKSHRPHHIMGLSATFMHLPNVADDPVYFWATQYLMATRESTLQTPNHQDPNRKFDAATHQLWVTPIYPPITRNVPRRALIMYGKTGAAAGIWTRVRGLGGLRRGSLLVSVLDQVDHRT